MCDLQSMNREAACCWSFRTDEKRLEISSCRSLKENRTLCLCVEYRKLSKGTRSDPSTSCLGRLHGLSLLDCSVQYPKQQRGLLVDPVALVVGYKKKISSHLEIFRYRQTLIRLKSAQGTFKIALDKILSVLCLPTRLVYLDDVMVVV